MLLGPSKVSIRVSEGSIRTGSHMGFIRLCLRGILLELGPTTVPLASQGGFLYDSTKF